MTIRELKRQIASIPDQFDTFTVGGVDFNGSYPFIDLTSNYGSLSDAWISESTERPPWLPELKVHLLLHGRPMCGFTDKQPKDWPIHDVWVGITDKEKCNCQHCLDALALNSVTYQERP